MDELLRTIKSPHDLEGLSDKQLGKLAGEMREALCRVCQTRTAHLASNLGVVELALALHSTFDFSKDRLIWDTGHQIYPHKMLTGRYPLFDTIRTKGGLMGYPNPAESPYDLLMTGHAGCSVSTALGLKCGDELANPDDDRHSVAVIGDGAFPSGAVFEAMNNAGGLKSNMTVVLNDNKMSICPRVGGMADSLDRLRLAPFYTGLKVDVLNILNKVPVLGDPVERFLTQVKDSLKAGLLGGMLFEELGFRYVGPVDGHNIHQLKKFLLMARKFEGPVLLHVVTEKGHGFKPAVEDPTTFHAPAPFKRENGEVVSLKKNRPAPYTQVVRDAVLENMHDDQRTVAITAAMTQGTKFEPIREQFPKRFFDVGICESHAVACYDQIFQEMSLQNMPVTLLLDRAGVAGPDGPTHHGVFDITYLRPLPNMLIMAPGDELDVAPMVKFALNHNGPAAVRYPKAPAELVEREPTPLELGRAETVREGRDGTLIACGTTLSACVEVSDRLAAEGMKIGVINARFIKPLDTETILAAIEESGFVLTVEEGALMGGFGSAVLEAGCDAGLNTSHLRRLGIPDQYVEHGTRGELLADLALDAEGIEKACRAMAKLTSESPALVQQPPAAK